MNIPVEEPSPDEEMEPDADAQRFPDLDLVEEPAFDNEMVGQEPVPEVPMIEAPQALPPRSPSPPSGRLASRLALLANPRPAYEYGQLNDELIQRIPPESNLKTPLIF